jgi:hypothetical protein
MAQQRGGGRIIIKRRDGWWISTPQLYGKP